METVNGAVGDGRRTADVVLGGVLLAGNAGTAYMIGASWGAAYVVVDLVVGVALGALALARGRWPVGSAVAGVVLAGGATVVARLAGLPREPGPIAVLALAVVVGSAVRRLAAPAAGAVAAAGLLVVAVTWWGAGHGVVPEVATAGGTGAVVVGAVLRYVDRKRDVGASRPH
jgi:hypothetical protein